MFNPAWGAWFSKFATGLKDMVTREHGELGAPGTVGEKFGEGGAKKEFDELMDRAQGKAAAEVKAQAQPASLLDQVAKPEEYTGEERRAGARPTMSATELEDAIKNRRPINNPFDQTEGARATMNRDPNMPQPQAYLRVYRDCQRLVLLKQLHLNRKPHFRAKRLLRAILKR